ncbi:uncharacterized protein RHOBADRAFT_53492 [Rhodotorula graminis WP1]|uniref:Uncharacterized protein n=1 Tax=Rhodotorula graminis (strain WP1) TaxID=578459 RepID=A0A194S7Y8_RHOGW|nr:uncharacterized protein RHOBADRAFT_53492 [Rhodotorula graminis WP1]KPV75521.1 hypothetical protein RHOBADRAFT_53492 [Rhodotorula graminis WP1]
MASPALSAVTASSSIATIVPSTATRLRQAALIEHERRDRPLAPPMNSTAGSNRARGPRGGLSASASVPYLSSGASDLGKAARSGGTKGAGGGGDGFVPRSTTSADLFGGVRGTGSSASWAAGRRQSEQRGFGGGAVSWLTTAPAEPDGDTHNRYPSSTAASTSSRTTTSSLFPLDRDGHDRHPSSSTSALPERSSSMYRTASNTTSSSTGSSDFPRTPAQLSSPLGAVVYRSSGSRSPMPQLGARKGKEREHEPGRAAWHAGAPVLTAPTSPSRRPPSQVRGLAPGPSVADPRFAFPMRRGAGAPTSSGGGGGGGGSSHVMRPSRSQLVGLGFRSAEPQAQEVTRTSLEGRRRGSTGCGLGESSFVANLATRPFSGDHDRLADAAYPSYAATPTGLLPPHDSSPSLSTPSLVAPSPILPTSPVAPTFPAPATPPASARRPSRTRQRSRKRPERRHSASSSTSSDNRPLKVRSASVPNLRKAAVGSRRHERRPSIPLEPRDPRTGSLEADRSLPGSLRQGPAPAVFPSKATGGTSRHRPHASEPLLSVAAKPPVPPRTRRNIVPVSKCEALIGARPRLVVVDAPSSFGPFDGGDGERRPGAVDHRRARQGALTDADVDLLANDGLDGDDSSVRRVLRDGALLRAERAAGSDSAMRGVGFGLSLKLAEQQRKAGRRSLAVEQRKAERRRMRREVAQRRRREAAEAESEAERGDGWYERRVRVAPDYSPPMPSSFEPFAQLGRKLSIQRMRERRLSTGGGGASDGLGLGFVNALKRVRSRSHVRSASATSTADVVAVATAAPSRPSTPRTVRGQAIRHLHRASSVDSLYARTHAHAASPPQLPQLPQMAKSTMFHSLAATVEQVTTQYGEALTSPLDQPFQPADAMRRPSVMTQNAFLSLPPHLHHLLRSPEHQSYTPARPAPSAPSAPATSAPTRVSTPDSTASAARLSLALEEHLREASGSPVKALEDMPVESTAPLSWRSRDGSSQGSPTSRLASSRSAPALAEAAGLSRSPTDKQLSAMGMDHPYAQRSTGRSAARRQPSQLSLQSSTGSVVDLTSDGNWTELFFLQPRQPDIARAQPSVSIETVESASSGDTSRNFRFATAPTQNSPSSRYAGTSFAAVDSIPPATRPSTSHTAYLTAEEGLSSAASSPERHRLGPPVAAGSGLLLRPHPTPVQSTWASTSFAREYIGTASSGSLRLSGGSGSGGSSRSFLRVEGSDSERDEREHLPRREASPSSFMDVSPPPSPRSAKLPSGLTLPYSALSPFAPCFPPSPSLDVDVARTPTGTHLSIDSRHFISPGRTSNSPLMASDGSRFSTLEETMDDFPAPPLLDPSGPEQVKDDSAASDGDDEDEGDERQANDEVTISRRPRSIDSLRVHMARAPPPDVRALPVVGERPVSSQSWLDFSDSEGR